MNLLARRAHRRLVAAGSGLDRVQRMGVLEQTRPVARGMSQGLTVLAGCGESGRMGLVNVDQRLYAVHGDEYGLELETAPEAGMKVTIRLLRSAPPGLVPMRAAGGQSV